MNLVKTGVFATEEQQKAVRDSFQLAYNTPVMATLPGGKVPKPVEDFRDMANRFAVESGLPEGNYAIDPETREFNKFT